MSAPTVETAWPSLVRRGRVIYCAGDLGYAYARAGYSDHMRLIGDCVRVLVGHKLPLEVEAPVTLDVALYRQGGRYLVHLVNLSTNQIADDSECEADAHEVIPLHDIVLRWRGAVSRVFRGSDGADLVTREEGGVTVAALPRLDVYDVVVIEP